MLRVGEFVDGLGRKEKREIVQDLCQLLYFSYYVRWGDKLPLLLASLAQKL